MKTSQLFPHSTYIPFRSSAGHSTEPPFLFFRIFRTPSAKTLFCFFRMARNMAFFVGSQLGLVIRPPGAWAFLPWVYIVNCFEFTIGRHRKASDRTEGNWKHWKASEGIGPNGRQLEALEGIGRHRIERWKDKQSFDIFNSKTANIKMYSFIIKIYKKVLTRIQ